MEPGSLLHQIDVLANSSLHYFHLVLKPYLLNIVKVYTDIVDYSKEVLDKLHNINETSRARCFDSYNFATLYIFHMMH